MRGHAKGPFSTQSNLRVQNVIQVTSSSGSAQVYVTASPEAPVLLRFCPHVDTALNTGTNVLLIGTDAAANAYYASGDVNPETAGFGTEKKFYLTVSGNINVLLTSTAISAVGTLTISAITAANTQTVTINGQVYTLQTSLVDAPNNVLIGADVTAMALNLSRAINAGAGAGTLYGTGTVANTGVTATSALGVLTVTAITAGSAGNSIATTETLTNSAWGAATLAGGENVASTGQLTIFIDA